MSSSWMYISFVDKAWTRFSRIKEIVCYSCNFKYAGCGKISQHLWLFSSFPETHLPTLLIRSAHDVHTSIHKPQWPSTSKTTGLNHSEPREGPQGKRPEEARAWGGSGLMLSKRANWAMPLRGAECFQLWDYTAHGWAAGKVCCLWTPFGIKPKCLNTKGKTTQCGWCHRASWGKRQG